MVGGNRYESVGELPPYGININFDLCQEKPLLVEELYPNEKITIILCFLQKDWMTQDNSVLYLNLNGEDIKINLKDYIKNGN